MRQIREGADQPVVARASSATFEEIANHYLKRPQGMSDSNRRKALRLRARFGHELAEGITQADVARFTRAELARIKPSSVQRTLAVLSAIYHTAIEDGLIRSMPKIKKPAGVVSRKDVAATPAERDRLIAACVGKFAPLQGPVAFMFLAGARPGEALGLQWADVDLDNRHVTLVTEKGYTGRRALRRVPLHERLVEMLERTPAEKRTGLVFPNARGQEFVDATFRRLFKSLVRSVGMPDDFTPNCCRHTFGTIVLHRTRDLKTTAELMGHTRLTTTERYISTTPDRLKGAIEVL